MIYSEDLVDWAEFTYEESDVSEMELGDRIRKKIDLPEGFDRFFFQLRFD